MYSKKFELSQTDVKAILRQITIIYTPVILLFLSQIENWEIDYKIILALAISTTIDICRRFLKDYTNETTIS